MQIHHDNFRKSLNRLQESLDDVKENNDVTRNLDDLNLFIEKIDDYFLPHFKIEEEEVLTALSTLTDIEDPVIDFIDREHDELRDLFDEFSGAVEEERKQVIISSGRKISALMIQHMVKEEESIYYMLDHFLTDEQIKLIDKKLSNTTLKNRENIF